MPLPPLDPKLPIVDSPLVGLTAVELARRFRDRESSAEEIVAAHIERIEAVDPHLNAVVVRCFERARATAREQDERRRRGESLGPLAGVPVTIKECFDVAGLPTTMGLEHWRERVAEIDSPLVARLRAAGAIVLGKTNVPQLMLLHETDNPLYGCTRHPLSANRSPGGSSGGEAAIITALGSPLGLGSDLGGSIRQPAHACGIAGLKPTAQRLSTLGCPSAFEGLEVMGVQPGPLARSVADLNLAMQVLAAPGLEQLDPQVPPVPWPDMNQVDVAKLRVGYWNDDGVFRASPAIRRAVDEAAAALQRAGVTVEPFSPPQLKAAVRLYFRIISADGGRYARSLLAGGRQQPLVARLLKLGSLPRWARPPLASVLSAVGQRGLANMVRSTGLSTTDSFWQLTRECRAYIRIFLEALDAHRYDALLCPPHGLVALTHGSFGYLPSAASYVMVPNLLGFPAGVVPWTTVQRGEESDRRASHDWVERAALAVEADSAGLSVGVQLFARPWREDIVLRLMSLVEELQPQA